LYVKNSDENKIIEIGDFTQLTIAGTNIAYLNNDFTLSTEGSNPPVNWSYSEISGGTPPRKLATRVEGGHEGT